MNIGGSLFDDDDNVVRDTTSTHSSQDKASSESEISSSANRSDEGSNQQQQHQGDDGGEGEGEDATMGGADASTHASDGAADPAAEENDDAPSPEEGNNGEQAHQGDGDASSSNSDADEADALSATDDNSGGTDGADDGGDAEAAGDEETTSAPRADEETEQQQPGGIDEEREAPATTDTVVPPPPAYATNSVFATKPSNASPFGFGGSSSPTTNGSASAAMSPFGAASNGVFGAKPLSAAAASTPFGGASVASPTSANSAAPSGNPFSFGAAPSKAVGGGGGMFGVSTANPFSSALSPSAATASSPASVPPPTATIASPTAASAGNVFGRGAFGSAPVGAPSALSGGGVFGQRTNSSAAVPLVSSPTGGGSVFGFAAAASSTTATNGIASPFASAAVAVTAPSVPAGETDVADTADDGDAPAEEENTQEGTSAVISAADAQNGDGVDEGSDHDDAQEEEQEGADNGDGNQGTADAPNAVEKGDDDAGDGDDADDGSADEEGGDEDDDDYEEVEEIVEEIVEEYEEEAPEEDNTNNSNEEADGGHQEGDGDDANDEEEGGGDSDDADAPVAAASPVSSSPFGSLFANAPQGSSANVATSFSSVVAKGGSSPSSTAATTNQASSSFGAALTKSPFGSFTANSNTAAMNGSGSSNPFAAPTVAAAAPQQAPVLPVATPAAVAPVFAAAPAPAQPAAVPAAQSSASSAELAALTEKHQASQKSLMGALVQLKESREKVAALTKETESLTAELADARSQLETTGQSHEQAMGALQATVEALQGELEESRAAAARYKAELTLNPKQRRVVEDLSSRLHEWFAAFTEEQQAALAEQLRGEAALGDEPTNAANEDDNATTTTPSAASSSLTALRSVQGLRDFFAAKLVAMGDAAEAQSLELTEARASIAAKEADMATLQIQLQAAEATIVELKAGDGAHVATVEGQLADALQQISTLRTAGEATRAAVESAREATEAANTRLGEVERRYASVLAAKEQSAEDLSHERSANDIAVRQLKAQLEAASVGRVEEVGALKRHISSLTALAAAASAEAAAAKRDKQRAEEEAAAAAAAAKKDEEEPPAKVGRSESAISPAAAAEEATAEDEDDERAAAEKLLNTKAAVFAFVADDESTEARPADPKLAALVAHAERLGLPMPSSVGAKRSRDSAVAAVKMPSFAEAASFYAKGSEHIAAVSKENASLRTALAKALHGQSRLKVLESSRSQTVGTFDALRTEIDLLRADNKHVRDHLAGVQAENKVLSTQLVSTMLAGLQSTGADPAQSVASPIAPLPPANLGGAFPLPAGGSALPDSYKLHPMPSPHADPATCYAARVQGIVASSLETIRRCATEMSARNSSITMNPEVQAAAAKQLHDVKNETMRLARHKEALMRLIEPREKRLASITAQLVRHAALGNTCTGTNNVTTTMFAESASPSSSAADASTSHHPLRSTASPPSAGTTPSAARACVSPSKPVHTIVSSAVRDVGAASPHSLVSSPQRPHGAGPFPKAVPMASAFGFGALVEDAVALALGFAEEQRTLLCVALPSQEAISSAAACSGDLPKAQSGDALARSVNLGSSLRTPSGGLAASVARVSGAVVGSPPLLALGGGAPMISLSLDGALGANTNTNAIACTNAFVAELLSRMGKMSGELEAVRARAEGEAASGPAKAALGATAASVREREAAALMQAADDAQATIAEQRKELAAVRAELLAAKRDAAVSNAKAGHMQALMGALGDASGAAIEACGTIAAARGAVADDLSKWRAKALLTTATMSDPTNMNGGAQTAVGSSNAQVLLLGLPDVVATAQGLAEGLAESLRHINATAVVSANAEQMAVASALCGALNTSDVALLAAVRRATALAEERAQQVLAQRITDDRLSEEVAAAPDCEGDDAIPSADDSHGAGAEEVPHEDCAVATVEDEEEKPSLEVEGEQRAQADGLDNDNATSPNAEEVAPEQEQADDHPEDEDARNEPAVPTEGDDEPTNADGDA